MLRKGRKGRKGGKKSSKRGQAANNTKVNIAAKYRILTDVTLQAATTIPGQYLWYAWSPQNANYTNVTQSAEFNVVKNLYDEFCVTAVKVTFRPYVNTTNPSNVSGGSFTSYTFIDRDGNAPVSASLDVPSKILAYDSCQMSRNFKVWTRTLKVKPFWTDCSTPTIDPKAQAGNAQPWIQAGTMAQLGFYAQSMGYPAANSIGQCEVDYFVKFRGKKTTAFAYDAASGSVILTPVSAFGLLPTMNPPLGVDLVNGETRLITDLSGNVQVESTLDASIAHLAYISSISYAASVPYSD